VFFRCAGFVRRYFRLPSSGFLSVAICFGRASFPRRRVLDR
jgi:hypothetical protein